MGNSGKIAIVSSLVLLAGCYFAPYFANRAEGGGTDAAEGEQHDVPYNANDSFLLTQDVLRGEGVLFEVKPDDKLVTLWKDADSGPGVLGSLVGVHPQYRYEIEVVPQGDRSSRIIVNVRAEDISDEDLHKYKATARLNLFGKIDQLAANSLPLAARPKRAASTTPCCPTRT